MKNVIVVTFALSILVALAPGLGSLKASYVAETDIRALQEDLADSHHTPLCVLVRRTGSKFEKRIAELWYDSSRPDTRDFASWRLAALNVTKVKHLPGYLLVNSEAPKSPFLRCFLGPTLQHDLMPTQLKPKQWLQWLNQLASQYRHQVQGSVEMIETSARQHRFTLVVFPTSHQHHQLEQAVFKLVGALFKETTIKVVVIHPTSVNLREIREEYHVTSVPSVLLIEKDRTSERKVSLYSIHDVTVNKFETDLRARLVPAHQFNMTDFQADVLTVKTSERYRPYLIGFYAHWEKDTAVFLTFLRLAAEEFLSMGASLRFGLVDAARNPSVISQFMSPGCLQHLPFLALFQRVDGTSSVNQTELLLLRPSPFTVYSALLEAGLTLTNMEHQPIRYQPYGHNTQVCLAREGPTGDTCAANSSVWLYPPDFLSTFLNYPDTVSAADRGEDQAGVGIPVVLGADWDTTQSHSNSDSQWIITVRVMVFIQEPCRSCEQNLPVFQQVYQQLHANGKTQRMPQATV
ncbi:uncharacterized protein [Littorina saxatilis]|uniref:Thioredoxin domain-containing protein n=1 Tax=Littorina saxatilis TaxID=31220 RepID=A0AAN9B7W4_9CAEN